MSVDLESIDRASSAPQTPTNHGSGDTKYGITFTAQDTESKYLCYKTEPVHDVLTNCYLGTGGCLCTVRDGNKSYISPNSREIQYWDRVDASERINFQRKSVDSRVGPIFIDSEIEDIISKNGEEIDVNTHNFSEWMEGYDVFLKEACTWATNNDVVYILTDKIPATGKITRNYRRAIDVLFEPVANEKDNTIDWVMFYDGKRVDPESIGASTTLYILKATQHFMRNGRYYKQKLEAPYTGAAKTRDEAWEKVGELIDTGADRMLVHAVVVGGHPEGTLLPEHPTGYEVARLDLLVMNMLSTLLWIQKVHGHPLAVIPGKVSGVNFNVASVLNPQSDASGAAPAMPMYLERDPDALRAGLELLQWAIAQVQEAMKLFGIIVQSNTDQAQTAESKQFDYQATNQALRNTVKTLCRPIDNIIVSDYMYLAANSTDKWTNKRTYRDDFFPDKGESVEELLDLEERAANRNLTGIMEQLWKVIVEMVAPNVSTTRKQELSEDLDKIKLLMVDDATPVPEENNL